MQKTKTTSQSEIVEKWYMIDAAGQRLGKVASAAAQLLMAKNDPTMRSYLMPKTKMIIINAADLDLTEKKRISKLYTNYSGFPGGLRTLTLDEVMQKDPREVIIKAVRGMLPRNKRGNHILDTNLYVYAGAEHKHEAQAAQVEQIKLDNFKI